MPKTMSGMLIALCATLYSASVFAAPPVAKTQQEITHLLGYLEQSNCQFFRNGKWYSAPEARAHLERKYDYLADRGYVDKTEDFIARGASQSSFSGKPYQVQCPGNAAQLSGQWLREELQQYRQQGSGS